MTTGLLASKLYFPPHRQDLVGRPRLLESLSAGLSGKLTLVSAPAGFGKTTLVSEWIRNCGYPAAWLSLDKSDNDLTRFLIYLIAALQRIDPEIGVEVRAALEASLSPQTETLLARLISDMEGLPEKSIIVLDDYHFIDSQPVHEVINFLIDYLPPTVHLVITGRADPPLPISRLRVRQDVNEIRTPALRFTEDEVATFLNDLMGFDLPSNGIAALEARTEGWIASLRLAALSMQGREDLPGFITEFSGSHRFIIDYLIDEVMARQPEEVQTFLRRTSILARFCAPLCEYVVGGSVQMDIIGYLDRSNLFLIPLDDHREWYRFHHLFADFLKQSLREFEPERIPELHRRASQWFSNEGLVDEAIQHALAAGDMDTAIRLVEQAAVDLVVRRDSNRLLKLIDRLPADRCKDYPLLCVWHAWALLFLGQLDAVEPILRDIESNQGKALDVAIKGYITTVRAYLANLEGDYINSAKLSEQALEAISKAPPDRIALIFQGSTVIWLGVNHRVLGNLDKAKQLFMEAARLNQQAGNFYAALASFEQLAKLAVVRGQLNEALDLYQSALRLAQNWIDRRGKRQRTLIAAAGPQLGFGTVLYQLNDLAGAADHVERSAELLELGELWARTYAYRMMAYLNQAEGEFEAAAELYAKACAVEDGSLVRQSNPTDLPSLVQLGILLSRAQPEMAYLLTDASRRIEKLGVHANDEVDFSGPSGYPYEHNYSDLARLFIALQRADEALPLLARLLESAVKMERHGDEIRYLVLIALSQDAVGDKQTALDSLSRALTLAEPQGYVRIFVDEGLPMARLLDFAISQNIAPHYASKLLAAFPKYVLSAIQIDMELAASVQELEEPLSQREIEVLRLMAQGCKYQEIAESLVVSINTVRHHIKNAYGKLHVNNRTQAIGRAKELNLL